MCLFNVLEEVMAISYVSGRVHMGESAEKSEEKGKEAKQ